MSDETMPDAPENQAQLEDRIPDAPITTFMTETTRVEGYYFVDELPPGWTEPRTFEFRRCSVVVWRNYWYAPSINGAARVYLGGWNVIMKGLAPIAPVAVLPVEMLARADQVMHTVHTGLVQGAARKLQEDPTKSGAIRARAVPVARD